MRIGFAFGFSRLCVGSRRLPPRSASGIGLNTPALFAWSGRAAGGQAGGQERDRLAGVLKPRETPRMPLAAPPPRENRFGAPLELSRVHWVRPELDRGPCQDLGQPSFTASTHPDAMFIDFLANGGQSGLNDG
jgi:hypothetical protein